MIELLLACAPDVDPVTMSAIIKQESGGRPWVINDNNGRRSYRLNSKAEAVLKATELISAGHSIDMGLAQINSKNLGWLNLSVEQVFNPCTNIAAGARVLRDGYMRTGSLMQALSMYNTGRANSSIGRRYAESVFRHAGVVGAGADFSSQAFLRDGMVVNLPGASPALLSDVVVPAIPGGRMADLPLSSSGVTQLHAQGVRVLRDPSAARSGFSPVWF